MITAAGTRRRRSWFRRRKAPLRSLRMRSRTRGFRSSSRTCNTKSTKDPCSGTRVPAVFTELCTFGSHLFYWYTRISSA